MWGISKYKTLAGVGVPLLKTPCEQERKNEASLDKVPSDDTQNFGAGLNDPLWSKKSVLKGKIMNENVVSWTFKS